MNKLQDKVIIITGGAGGIGRGMALAMAKEGAKIVIVDMNPDAGKATVAEIQKYSPESIFIQFDLTKHDELHKIIDQTIETFGKLHVLVNNAHASKQVMIAETTKEQVEFSFNTSFYPTLFLMQAALPHLRETKGNIINFSSGAGLLGQPTQAAYGSAKEAIRALSRTAANEFAVDGITVNIISPLAMTEGVERWKDSFPDMYEESLQKVPLRRFGDPENDIGKAAVFLASEDSKYITGQTIMVDGGSVMLR